MTVKNPSIKLNQTEATLAVNETVKLTATTAPKSAASTVTYTSDKPEIATVAADGTVTAVAEGTATVTATAKCGSKTVKAEAKVTVVKFNFQDVKQTKIQTLEATISGKTSELKTSDVAVKDTTTKTDVLVKAVTPDKTDAKKVTIETYVDMTNSDDIEVTIAGTTKTIKATDGTVSSLAVDPVQIPYGKATDIEAVANDTKGVELKRFKYNNEPKNYTFTIDAGANGYTTDSKLYLNKKGDTAKATITYSTGKYDENGKELKVEAKDVVITAVDPETIGIGNVKLRIADKPGEKFDDLKDGGKVAKGDTNKFAAIKITDSKDKEIDNYGDYTVETSNKDILIITGTLSGSTSTATIGLEPVAEGNAAIIVKDKDGKTMAALPIAVNPERKVSRLEIDTNSITLSNASGAPSKKVKLTVYDQYQEKMDKAAYKTKVVPNDNKTTDTSVTVTPASGAPEDNNIEEVVFAANGNVGKYAYKICVGDFARVVNVEVKAPDSNAKSTYDFDMSDTTKDAVVKETKDMTKNVTVQIEELKGGVFKQYESISDWTVTLKDKDGNTAKLEDGTTVALDTVSISTCASIQVVKNVGGVAYKLPAGTYKLEAVNKSDNTKKITRSFVVTDSQPKVSVSREKDSCTVTGADGDTKAKDAVEKCFKFVYGNWNSTDNSDKISVVSAKVKGTLKQGDNSFESAIVKVTLDSGAVFAVKVDLNKTVSISGV